MRAHIGPTDRLIAQRCGDHASLNVFVEDIVDEQGGTPIAGIILHRTIGDGVAVECDAGAASTRACQDIALVAEAEVVEDNRAVLEFLIVGTKQCKLIFR